MHNANHEEPEEISTQESSLQGTSLEDSTEQPVPSVPVVLSLPEEEDMMRVFFILDKNHFIKS